MQRMWRRGPDGEIIRTPPEAVEPSPAGPDAENPARGSEAATPRPRASVRLALKLGFRDTYDYLGSVLVMSVLSVLLPLVGALAGHACGTLAFRTVPAPLGWLLTLISGLLGWGLVWGPTAAGLHRFSRNAAARREPEIFDLAWGLREAFGRSVRLGLLQVLGTALLIGNCAFYFSRQQPLFAVLGALLLYALFFWLLMSLYQWPLMIEQDLLPGAVVRKSALLVLDNFGYSLIVGLVLGVIALLLWSFAVPGILLWAGSSAVIQTQATRELLRRYGVLPPDPTLDPIAEETHEFGGRGWHE